MSLWVSEKLFPLGKLWVSNLAECTAATVISPIVFGSFGDFSELSVYSLNGIGGVDNLSNCRRPENAVGLQNSVSMVLDLIVCCRFVWPPGLLL